MFAYGIETACDKNEWIIDSTANLGNEHDSRTFKGSMTNLHMLEWNTVLLMLVIKLRQNDMYPLYWTTSKEGIFMRYSYEFKMMCVELYHSGSYPDIPEGLNPNTLKRHIREWSRFPLFLSVLMYLSNFSYLNNTAFFYTCQLFVSKRPTIDTLVWEVSAVYKCGSHSVHHKHTRTSRKTLCFLP